MAQRLSLSLCTVPLLLRRLLFHLPSSRRPRAHVKLSSILPARLTLQNARARFATSIFSRARTQICRRPEEENKGRSCLGPDDDEVVYQHVKYEVQCRNLRRKLPKVKGQEESVFSDSSNVSSDSSIMHTIDRIV